MDLTTSLENINGIGPVSARRLKKLGIKTVEDLFYHFPSHYEDFSNLLSISNIKIGQICTIQGKVIDIQSSRTWKRKLFITEALIQDKTGAMRAVWFNRPYLSKTLKPGDYIFLSGKSAIDEKGGAYLTNPSYEKIPAAAAETELNLTHTGRLIPVYPETEGMSSRWIRYLLKPLLLQLKNFIPEILPEKLTREQNLIPAKDALWQIHFPDSKKSAEEAEKRFSFEELFLIELFVLWERAKLNQEKAIALPLNAELIKRFTDSLPYKLTDAQRKCAWRILKDMELPRPMNRLLEGDVGSGKTVVAAIAALNAAKLKCQTAFMAPTEILAKQHFNEISKIFSIFNLNIGLLTGKQDIYRSKKLKNQNIEVSRKKLIEKSLDGEIDILIGTHALIQDEVRFKNLALVVLDEQHRFGVKQRAGLCKTDKSAAEKTIPHLLSMTATPIPRTLSLTIYGDLDLSIIDQLPKGRKKIITKVVSPIDREKTYEFIREEIKAGRQAFVICPRIEIQDKTKTRKEDMTGWAEAKSVEEEFEKLSKKIFPELKVEMLHGKLTPQEKEKIMRNFKLGKTNILVSTSVVEVGIDIQNATVMMIEGAERFGLAQLHQFRGRVGRGDYQSYCLLFTDSKSPKTKQRLHALITCENGFALAQKDLEIRGPGEFAGTKQWGIPDITMNSFKDINLVEKTREAAKKILLEDPRLQKYPLLNDRLQKFREKIHLE